MEGDCLNQLKAFCKTEAIDLFGVADITRVKKDILLKAALLKDFNRAICLGARLSSAVLEEIERQPTKLYFHHYRTVNMFLDQAALRLTSLIQRKGFRALPIPASQIVDWQKQTAHLSHRQLGVLAGLGWIGRNNLLVNEKFGSQFRLVSILTDAPLAASKPVKKDCGECFACIAVCPAGAIKEKPRDFDHLKCLALLKDFQKQHIVEQYICGICVKACKGKAARK
ncbi:MAG: hypothetical protein ACOY3D_08775 [Candidatus Omnitrophota bacterium]